MLAIRRLVRTPPLRVPARTLTMSAASLKNMPSRPKPPPDSEIEESYLKGSGPGGQKINKTNSAVQLKHIPTGIVVKSQATRSRSQNRKHAREILAQRLDDLVNGEESRSAVVGGIKKKRADSKAKKSRRKYRKLEEEKKAREMEEEEEEEEEEGHTDKGNDGEGQKEMEMEEQKGESRSGEEHPRPSLDEAGRRGEGEERLSDRAGTEDNSGGTRSGDGSGGGIHRP